MNDDLEKKYNIDRLLNNKKLSGEDIKFNLDDLYLGEIREFSTEKNGVSVDLYSYLFLIKGKDGYFNPLCITDTENYPVYSISKCFGSCTISGIETGNKVYHVQGEEKDGPCIIISPFTDKVKRQLNKEIVSLADLDNYILRVKGFFKDKEEIVSDNFLNPVLRYMLLKDDITKKDKYDSFMESTKQLRK